MARVDWTVRGTLLLAPQSSDIAASYGTQVPLSGVRVLVEAKEYGWDTGWSNWGETYTGKAGHFSITKEKDQTDRMFRVRVMFKNDELKIYPPNEGLVAKLLEVLTDVSPVVDLTEDLIEEALDHFSRLTYDVDWFTVHKDGTDDKHPPKTVDLGPLCFTAGGGDDLGDRTARRHAEIWYVCRLAMEFLEASGKRMGFPSDKPVAVLHPHDNPLVGDAIETSYANPFNNVVFLLENSRKDHFNPESILHELMHLWVYQRTTGEDALAWQAIVHGGTHDSIQAKSWVAAHEAVAEWAAFNLYRHLFGRWPDIYGEAEARALPFTWEFLRTKGVTSLSLAERSEWAWMSLLSILRNPDIATIDVTGSGTYAPQNYPAVVTRQGAPLDPPPLGGAEPTFVDVLNVLNVHSTQGTLDRDELTFEQFVDRALAVMPQQSTSSKSTILGLLSPSPRGGNRPRANGPRRDLKSPPITR